MGDLVYLQTLYACCRCGLLIEKDAPHATIEVCDRAYINALRNLRDDV